MPDAQPNYLNIDPSTGAVGAVFPGGVKVPLPPLDRSDQTNQITWVPDSGGGLVAMTAFTIFGSSTFGIKATSPDGAHNTELSLNGGSSGDVSVIIDNDANTDATIMDIDGQSSFIQIYPSARRIRLAGPYIFDSGVLPAQNSFANVDHSHNFGINTGATSLFPIGAPQDGGWGENVGWITNLGINTTRYTFVNTGTQPNARMLLHVFYLLIGP